MNFEIQRENLLKPLQSLMGVVEKRHTMAILGNILFAVKGNQLTLTATDLEIELIATIAIEHATAEGKLTLPARKLLDICRSLSDDAVLKFTVDDDQRPVVSSGRSRFSLSSLPPETFPNVEEQVDGRKITLKQSELLALLRRTHFSMAQQDVRYFLNGLLFELTPNLIRVVATDGHRLALATHAIELPESETPFQVIIPRKAVIELMRLLDDTDDTVMLHISEKHIRATLPSYIFTSKLIDGRYPDYNRVIPQEGNNVLNADGDNLKHALSRAAILSNEQYRGVRLKFKPGTLHVSANNPEQEEAQDEVEVDYTGVELEVGFNVGYLLDVLSNVGKKVQISLLDANASARIQDEDNPSCLYVVMPIRL